MAPSPQHKRERSESNRESEQQQLDKARQRKGLAELRDRAPEQDAGEKEIQYSKDQAPKRPGYDGFHANQNRKLKGPERVKFWAFTAKFAEDYFKELQYVLTTSMFINPIPHHLSNLLPGTAREEDHMVDMAALNIGTIALAEAKNTTRVIEIFGEDGPRMSSEVVDMINKDEVMGSGVLLDFLEQWEQYYPSTVT
jgi:hypothetical protein